MVFFPSVFKSSISAVGHLPLLSSWRRLISVLLLFDVSKAALQFCLSHRSVFNFSAPRGVMRNDLYMHGVP